MKAVYSPTDGLLVRRSPQSQPCPPGHVVVDVAYCGICGTDLHVVGGAMDHRVGVERIIGHEMVGTISQVSDDVSGWQPGDRVTVLPVVSCGECRACDRGDEHVCPNLTFLGIDADGGMQRHWLVPSGNLIRLESRIPLVEAALAEPLAVAVHDVERAGVRDGEQVLVVGGGPVGVLLGLVAQARGADVVISEPHPARREIAAACGIVAVAPDEPVSPRGPEADPDGFDIAFEASGSALGIDAALAAVRVRGRIVQVGVHTAPREVDLHRVFWRELDLLGARLYHRRDFEEAARLLAEGTLTLSPLISRVMPMDSVGEAVELLRSGNVMKVLVHFDEEARP